MGDDRYNSGINLKLVLLCFLFAGAAIAEEITPSFSVAPNDRFAQGKIQYQVTWEIDEGLIYFTANCRAHSGRLSEYDLLVSEKAERRERYRAMCRLDLSTPLMKRFKLFGSEIPRDNFDAYKETLKKIHHELINGRSLTLESYNVFRLAGDTDSTYLLKPSEDYIAGINNFIELVEAKNIKAAAEAVERKKRAVERAEKRKIRERNSAIALTFLAAFGLVMLYTIYRSGIIQRGFRASSDRVASAIENSKIKIREKKRLGSAKELVVWSQLREKGHITEEEFEKKKRDLMG